jgi:hypothetical protein
MAIKIRPDGTQEYYEPTADDIARLNAIRARQQVRKQARLAEKARVATFDENSKVAQYKIALRSGDANAVLNFVLGEIGDISAVNDIATARQVMNKLAYGLAYTNAMLARVANRLLKSAETNKPPRPK